MTVGNEAIFQAILGELQAKGIVHRVVEHQPTFTSEESAAARGEPLHVGAKALLLKCDEQFRLFVLPADQKLDSNSIKKSLGVKKLRFATAEELMELTGLVPGSVPPFGPPILPFPLHADDRIGTIEDKVAFNAGMLTRSIVMKASDWRSMIELGESR